MSLEAIENISSDLENNKINAEKAIVRSISEIEDFPYFKSVGYGGLPNEEMEVELDAAYMDGSDFSFGAVMAVQDFKNPIKIAHALSKEYTNCVLVSKGAMQYARSKGFIEKKMLSDRAIIHYQKRKKAMLTELKPYIGHDTVGICVLDNEANICVGTSTSGLFMKKKGRIGDSPIIGSGFYADSNIGACTATGLGEDLMKGCIAYEVVSLMNKGYTVQKACEIAIKELNDKLLKKRNKVGDLSIVAIDKEGNFGCATNIDNFSFVYASAKQKPTVYLVSKENGKMTFTIASKEWLDDYLKTRMEKLEL